MWSKYRLHFLILKYPMFPGQEAIGSFLADTNPKADQQIFTL